MPETVISRLRALVGNARCAWFDLCHGVQTRNELQSHSLEIDSPNREHGTHYSPTHPKFMRTVLQRLPIEHKQYCFVDYGSGKGRVLLVAASYPFQRIVGVEYARELHEIAKRNLERYRGRRACKTIELVHADALAFEIPHNPLVIFMFNPFRPPVLGPLMEKIGNSLLECPRDAWLIYASPFHTSLISNPFTLVESGTYHNVYHGSPAAKGLDDFRRPG
jgi:Histone methylation protein DOT1